MGLFDFLKKKKRQQPAQRVVPHKHEPTNHTSVRMDRLTKDGELPSGWFYNNRAEIERINAIHQTLFLDVQNTWHERPRTHLAALKSYVLFMDETKNACIKKGECFLFWYHEYFDIGGHANYIERYEYYRDNIDSIEKKHMRKEQIQKEILEIITTNPNILQTDVYKKFAPDEKGIVSSELYGYAAEGKIERTKSGRTYSLRIK